MEKVLTLQEIEERFDDEWVLVGDPETNEQLEVVRGAVLHHSKNRDEVYNRALTLSRLPAGLRRFAILCNCQIPDDAAVIL